MAKDRDAELAMHPTVKPLALVADAILAAAERNELDPHCLDTIVRRCDDVCGLKAVRIESGKNFAELQTEREEVRNGKKADRQARA